VLLFVKNPVDVTPAVTVHRFGVPPGRAIALAEPSAAGAFGCG
jgi:hypothetical protein